MILYVTPQPKSVPLLRKGIEKYKNNRGRGLSEKPLTLAPEKPEKGKGISKERMHFRCSGGIV